jgi:hypothetical protein
MTNPLHKVAERIGIEWVDDDWGGAWWDQHDETSRYGIHEAKLREHLLTGDRPLRIMVEFGISVVLDDELGLWHAWGYEKDFEGPPYETHQLDHPAHAVLAWAEACA